MRLARAAGAGRCRCHGRLGEPEVVELLVDCWLPLPHLPAQVLVHRPGPPRAREAPPTDKARTTMMARRVSAGLIAILLQIVIPSREVLGYVRRLA
ncbi:hypothetical protein B0H13DRAFT_2674387 [Mycena leptocephala]|nr:hypothetical protein B0H13DRAFT_2674387 [Mycena leptocephala]